MMKWQFLIVLLITSQATAAVSVVDDAGRTVTLAQPALRIVSLAPHVTELLFAAGAGNAVVGAVRYSDFPPEAKQVPMVGDYNALDLETLLSLKPDLIVAWQSGNPASAIERLLKFNIPVFLSEPRRLEDIATNLERLGQLAGTKTSADAASTEFRRQLQRLRANYAAKPLVTVFYQIWDRPLITLNGAHMISAVLELCGGKNLFSDLPVLAPEVSMESVLKADPAAIIASGSASSEDHGLGQWARWTSLQAVRNKQLYFVEPDTIQRSTPRILSGAAEICRVLESARRFRQ
ncbi:MAG: cobalamin-binding protein [Gammaproteobacteria bacterium]|nr:cobalamin-binding protein [Gammaproteobacteria bacterium]